MRSRIFRSSSATLAAATRSVPISSSDLPVFAQRRIQLVLLLELARPLDVHARRFFLRAAQVDLVLRVVGIPWTALVKYATAASQSRSRGRRPARGGRPATRRSRSPAAPGQKKEVYAHIRFSLCRLLSPHRDRLAALAVRRIPSRPTRRRSARSCTARAPVPLPTRTAATPRPSEKIATFLPPLLQRPDELQRNRRRRRRRRRRSPGSPRRRRRRRHAAGFGGGGGRRRLHVEPERIPRPRPRLRRRLLQRLEPDIQLPGSGLGPSSAAAAGVRCIPRLVRRRRRLAGRGPHRRKPPAPRARRRAAPGSAVADAAMALSSPASPDRK